MQSAPAAASGPLPDVLQLTFPATFPTPSAARRVIRKDLVLIEGVTGSCKSEVAAGQLLQQMEPVVKHKAPRTVSLEVVYEDDHLAVVHKPWGVKMYGGDGRRTITGALRAGALQPSTQPDWLQAEGGRAVHRLDAAVGGLVLVAKTASALVDLSAQFAERRVHKVYRALLQGRLEPAAAAAVQQLQLQAGDGSASDEGEAPSGQEDGQQQQQQQPDLPLPELLQLQLQGRPAFSTSAEELRDACLELAEPVSSSNSSRSSLGLEPGVQVVELLLYGKPCFSLFKVLGHSRCGRFGGWMTSVALSPVTGRRHQLRRSAAALGHPIVGDGLYSADKTEHISNQGIYLESLELSFTHPASQQLINIAIPEPPRFATLRQQQHGRWKKLQQSQQHEQQQPGAGE